MDMGVNLFTMDVECQSPLEVLHLSPEAIEAYVSVVAVDWSDSMTLRTTSIVLSIALV